MGNKNEIPLKYHVLYWRVFLTRISTVSGMNNTNIHTLTHTKHTLMPSNEPFSPRSFVVPSPGGRERIYTTLAHGRLLLTANAASVDYKREKETIYSITVDEFPVVKIGAPLLSLGVPLFGMLTAIIPLPSTDGIFRAVLLYHPLPKPNIGKPVSET